jgi:hypothetical protein
LVSSSRDRTIFGFSLDMTSPIDGPSLDAVDRDRTRVTIVASAGAPGKHPGDATARHRAA